MLIPFYLVTPLINAFRSIWQKTVCCIALFAAMWGMNACGIPLDSRIALYSPIYSAGIIIGSRVDISEEPRPFLLAGGFLVFCAGVFLIKHSPCGACSA